MRGCFTFVSALMSLLNGLASLENNQLDIVLQRVRSADEELTKDEDWPGKTVLRGLCNLVAGVVEIMQGMPSRGVWHVLRSWFWLRNLEVEALNYEGHERCCVRSTALLALGVFNLFVSMLPPTAMKAAGWATGFAGGRDVALAQLQSCWEEGGIQAPGRGVRDWNWWS
ncbi:Ank3 [Symbiodinium natans]|uniref:Ank3 protein n=1 Tax=Symbiodinium natans TaxID=878477 RepID=A0A812LX51_9DINO|nr:Ank3 [Symbiodinium natans]